MNWSYSNSPVLHSFLPLAIEEISACLLRHANNFQPPLSKRSLVHNSIFYKDQLNIKLSSSFTAFK